MTKQSRRPPGRGSVYQEPDGGWTAALSFGTIDGKRVRKKFSANSKDEAYELLDQALHAEERGEPLTRPDQTVAEYLTGWLEDVAAQRVEAKTLSAYRFAIVKHLVPELGRLQLVDLKPAHIQSLLRRKRAGGLSPRTCLHLRAVLRTALADAVKWELVTRNAAALADAPKVARTEPDPVSLDEAKAFLGALEGDRHRALYLILLTLGMRQAEALGLRWSDVDLDAGVLRIVQTLERLDGAYRMKGRKTDKPRRTLPLEPFHVAALREHRRLQLGERIQAASWMDSGLVFVNETGGPLNGSVVTHHLARILARAGLKHRNCRDLRHGAATLLLALGADLATIRDILGHTTIRTTADFYTHVLPSVGREAIGRLGWALGDSI